MLVRKAVSCIKLKKGIRQWNEKKLNLNYLMQYLNEDGVTSSYFLNYIINIK